MFGLLRRKQKGWLAIGFFAGRIDLAHVQRTNSGRPTLLRLESYARPADDANALVTLRKQNKFKGFRLTTLMDPGCYQIVQVDAPEVPDDELSEAVRWRLKDVLDFPVDRATVDVARLPVHQAGRAPQLLAVAASDTVLSLRMDFFDRARLDLQAVDVPEMAQRNVAALFEEENRGLAMLALDDSGGTLTFTYQGELCAFRHIEVTTAQLHSATADRLSALFERIGLELQRSLDNFERQYSAISVSRLLLMPCPSAPGLAEYLRDYVYIPVVTADLTSVIDCEKVPELRDPALQAERLQVIGAALRDEPTEASA